MCTKSGFCALQTQQPTPNQLERFVLTSEKMFEVWSTHVQRVEAAKKVRENTVLDVLCVTNRDAVGAGVFAFLDTSTCLKPRKNVCPVFREEV